MHVAGRPAAPELSGQVTTRGVRVGGFTLGDLAADLRLRGDELVVDRLAVAAQGAPAGSPRTAA